MKLEIEFQESNLFVSIFIILVIICSLRHIVYKVIGTCFTLSLYLTLLMLPYLSSLSH